MKDKTKKWLAVAGLLAVCAVLVFGISRVLYHEPDREAQVVERESEETELFVETETPEPAAGRKHRSRDGRAACDRDGDRNFRK